MIRIRFFVTGKTEEVLPRSFSRLFPTGTFTARRIEGFTSSPLDGARPTDRAQETLGDLVGAVQRNGGADYAILVDDLALTNVGRAADVVAYFRTAAQSLARTKSPPTVRRLRRCVSVHLLAPMVEAYFFCDPAALHAAGVSSSVAPLVGPGAPEHFHTLDPAYLEPTSESRRAREARPSAGRWRTSLRCVHPKHYLMHLLERSGKAYSEVREGRRALAATDLSKAWTLPGAVWPLLGALVDDVADILGVTSPTPSLTDAPTSTANGGTVLRNL